MTSSSTQAALFRSLHHASHPLALSNVWDVASAVLTQHAGARAVATTSAGIAWSLGLPDGDVLDRAQAVAAVARIVSAVTLPVTADLEGGYATSPEGVAQTVAEVVDAGAVGINLEDGRRSPDDLAARIAAARQAADAAGVDLFINARTDVFLAGSESDDERVDEALARAALYVDAGADGLFVPGASTASAVRALVDGAGVPVNIMVGPGSSDVAGLARLGVARVSLGSAVAQAAYAVAQRAASELLAAGTYDSLAGALDYGALNTVFSAQPAH